MPAQQTIARSMLTLEQRLNLILANLERYFDHAKNPLIHHGSFKTVVWSPIHQLDDPGVDDLVEIIRQIVDLDARSWPAEKLTGGPFSALIVSATYCYRALSSLQDGYRELAWTRLAEASFWCGVMLSGKGIKAAYERTLKESRSQNARKGGDVVAAKKQPIIEYAQQLARAKPQPHGWTSRNHAVQTIYQRVNNFAAAQGQKTYSQKQAEETMGAWLSKMPDASTLFPATKGKKKTGK